MVGRKSRKEKVPDRSVNADLYEVHKREVGQEVGPTVSGGVYRVGGGVTVPELISGREAEYTVEARAARIEGTIELVVTIGQDGVPRETKIQKALGCGLDEKAIQCVAQWRFTPGVYQGSPVPVAASIHMNFRLETPDRYSSGGVIATLEFY
jgi:TonB family protein